MAVATGDEDTVLAHGWQLAVRVAVVSSLLMAALGAALYRFAGLGSVPIVGITLAVGLAIGLRLPPARP
jgi:hypothetical protein